MKNATYPYISFSEDGKIQYKSQKFHNGDYVETVVKFCPKNGAYYPYSTEDEPSEVWFNSKHEKIKEIFRNKQALEHRLNGPALTIYTKTGEIISETWFKKGQEHRDGGPSSVYYDDDGKVEKWSWFVNGANYNPWIQRWCNNNGMTQMPRDLSEEQTILLKLQLGI